MESTGNKLVAAEALTTARAIAAALRARVLTLLPEDIGLPSTVEVEQELNAINGLTINGPTISSAIFGVVIETAHPDAVASLIVLADGSVSFYVSDGNGCVGCGAHREVRWAGADLLQIAEKSLPLSSSTADVGLPPQGHVRFYFLTRDGLRSIESRLENINQIDERLGVLYFAGQRVLAAVERVGAGQSLAQEIRKALGAIHDIGDGVKDASRDQLSTTEYGESQCLSVGNAVRRLRP